MPPIGVNTLSDTLSPRKPVHFNQLSRGKRSLARIGVMLPTRGKQVRRFIVICY